MINVFDTEIRLADDRKSKGGTPDDHNATCPVGIRDYSD